MSVLRNTRGVAQKGDLERRKRLWLEPVWADLKTAPAREDAAKHHVSLRLARAVAGHIVNLESFIQNPGHVWASYSGLGKIIKNANGVATSGRQIQRAIAFLAARDHLRVVHRDGGTNLLYPRYRKAIESAETRSEGADTVSRVMSGDLGHDVVPPLTSCPTKLSIKPLSQTTETTLPQPPLTIVQAENGQASKRGYEAYEVILGRIAVRLGYGSAKDGWAVLLSLPEELHHHLVKLERAGELTGTEVAKLRCSTAEPLPAADESETELGRLMRLRLREGGWQ